MRTRLAWFAMLALVVGLVSAGSVAAAGDTVVLTARLVGAQEVPPADPDGVAKATIHVNVTAGEVCFEIKNVKDTETPNRGHIHHAPTGQNGPIVVPFFELRPGDATVNDPRHDEIESGSIEDCVPGDPAILADIVAHPDQYYVNVHNTRFPGGVLRCVLEARG
ncbi:MAG: CHRD domain-containing protein [Chloroflexota bacterium]